IEVTFDIDANGILHVSAVDKGSGKSQSISITATNKLKPEEIEKMKKEAEQFAEQDRKRKEEIEKINTAESLAYTVEKTINEAGNKIDENTKKEIQGKVKELRDAMGKKDIPQIDKLMEELSKKIQEVGAKMYQSAGSQSSSAGGGDSAQGDQQNQEATAEQKVYDTNYNEKKP
ncbi:MAG TPA: Hsp70 family protein, partial [Thermoplasmataceae archaeon]|nr:Hsp70 family protein [Thermoplasmataceae archaeon]